MEDPGADLAGGAGHRVRMARLARWPGRVAAFGELSLTGQVRYVVQGEQRVAELARRGFERVLLPRRNAEELRAHADCRPAWSCQPVDELRQVLQATIG